MLSLQANSTRLCDGISRREMMRVGGLGALGLSLPQLLREQAGGAQRGSLRRAKRCIILFLLGGPPQHETFDPKPNAPAEIRGEFQPIASATPGLQVGELMPRTASLTEEIAVLRAMSTDDNAHSSSGYWMLTGYPHAPKNRENAKPGAPNNWPCLAAMTRHLMGDRGSLPASIRLPEEIWNTGRLVWPGQDAGFLSAAADPWLLTCDPNSPDFQAPDIGLPDDVSTARMAGRRRLLDVVNRSLDDVERGRDISRWNGLQNKALDLLSSSRTRRAFRLDEESTKVRERYGRNRFGQSVLLARRLVEADVSLVQVNWTRWKHDQAVAPAWDSHAKHAERLKKDLMPPMDLAYSALLEDLKQRGMLEDTLVVWMGEFGRTPTINKRGGRDHWGHVFCTALAGGGVQGGAVHGASDSRGAYPAAGRVEPHDLSATIFHCLGFPPSTEVQDRIGRRLVISKGEPIWEVLS